MALVKYEVYVFRDQRWILETSHREEGPAKAAAQSSLKDPKIAGVRVVREKRRPDGGFDEEILFGALPQGGKKKDFSLAEITVAPVCETLADLYRSIWTMWF
ncbi:MAG: hypothetical protein FD149_1719 [Rhodospirillaceae bacterium]|nr:MAG: hypothetical protein FD149_1719 [Rhodospirillaceae bacterium]